MSRQALPRLSRKLFVDSVGVKEAHALICCSAYDTDPMPRPCYHGCSSSCEEWQEGDERGRAGICRLTSAGNPADIPGEMPAYPQSPARNPCGPLAEPYGRLVPAGESPTEANGSFIPTGEPLAEGNGSLVSTGATTAEVNGSFVATGGPLVPMKNRLVPISEPSAPVKSRLVPVGEPPVPVKSSLVPASGPPVRVDGPLVPVRGPSVEVHGWLVPSSHRLWGWRNPVV